MTQTVRTIWNAWEEQTQTFEFPQTWNIHEHQLPLTGALGEAEIHAVLETAFRDPEWLSIAGPARSVCILVDDLTRPVQWGPVLRPLLELLATAGKPASSIRLLVSLAGHAPMSQTELEWKLGAAIVQNYRIAQHSLDGPFEWIEVNGQRVGLHRDYVTADCRIALGSLIPHPFAGFSGGGKAVMPGIADHDTIRRNHALVAFGRGKVADTKNGIREQMESIAAASGLHLLVNAMVNGRREIAALFAGRPAETYREGAATARRYCASPPINDPNIIVLNAYPKDREMLQVSNAFNVLRTLPAASIPRVAATVLIARATSGLGFHALFGPGGALWRKPMPVSSLKHAPMLVYAPGLDPAALDATLHGTLFTNWNELLRHLESLQLPRYDVAFYHQASLQTAEGHEG